MIQILITLLLSLGKISTAEQWETLTTHEQNTLLEGVIIEDIVAN